MGRYLSASINATLASIYRPWLLRTLPRLPSAVKKKVNKMLIKIESILWYWYKTKTKKWWKKGIRENRLKCKLKVMCIKNSMFLLLYVCSIFWNVWVFLSSALVYRALNSQTFDLQTTQCKYKQITCIFEMSDTIKLLNGLKSVVPIKDRINECMTTTVWHKHWMTVPSCLIPCY